MKYLKTFELYSSEERNIDNVLDKANAKGGISYLNDEEIDILKNMGKIYNNEEIINTDNITRIIFLFFIHFPPLMTPLLTPNES